MVLQINKGNVNNNSLGNNFYMFFFQKVQRFFKRALIRYSDLIVILSKFGVIC